MIESFGNRLAEALFYDKSSRATKAFPQELRRIARRKLLYLHDAAELKDLRVPPGNRKGLHSIRISDQWRVEFRWQNGQALDVEIADYH